MKDCRLEAARRISWQKFRVIFTQSAWNDLEEIVACWTSRDQAERGE
jgi:hypothetical protein